jgi:hypothetical protein
MSKLVRIESGGVAISLGDLRLLLDYYQEVDQAVIAELLELARQSRMRNGVGGFRNLVSRACLDLIGYEQDANIIRQFHPVVIPDLMQAEGYAHAVIVDMASLARRADEADALLRLHQRRQESVFGRHDGPRVTAVFDEASIVRAPGGATILRHQLDHLLELAGHGRVRLCMLPLAAEPYPGLAAPFSLLEFESVEDPGIACLEACPGDVELIDMPDCVDRYRMRFDVMLDAGCSHDETIAHLTQRQRGLR